MRRHIEATDGTALRQAMLEFIDVAKLKILEYVRDNLVVAVD
jgi:hypothetical protein